MTMIKFLVVVFLSSYPLLIHGRLRYCDKVFDLLNRTDESFSTCRWLEAGHVSELGPCTGGVTCGEECVPYHLWCKPEHGTPHVTRCGARLYSPDTCRNGTFWSRHPCDQDPDTARSRGRRCSGWWPGECDTGAGCRDGSHELTENTSDTCLVNSDHVVNITSQFFTCPSKFNDNVTVCATRCDRVLDGCLGDLDEEDCAAKGDTAILILALIPSIIITVIVIELIYRFMIIEDRNVEKKEESCNVEILLRDETGAGESRGEHLSEFLSLLLDPDNWDLGLRDDSNLLSPTYDEGGFDVTKMPRMRQLYTQIRNSAPESSLRFILFSIRPDPAALAHYSHCLLYNVLEREYSATRGQPHLDLSIKQALTTRHSKAFYGQVFPFFDPIGMLFKSKYGRVVYTFFMKLVAKIPSLMMYLLSVTLAILGWYVDFIKDILIAHDILFLFTCLSCDFKSVIVVLQWVTVFFSQTVIGLRVLVSVIRDPAVVFGSRARKWLKS